MNIKREISVSLYHVIRDKYEGGLYRDAILAATFYLQECIIVKANLDKNKIAQNHSSLITEAFGMPHPIIKVNSMNSVSKVFEQNCFEQLMLGVYQGIRYSRMHGEFDDDRKTANAIIVFIDYLINRILDSIIQEECEVIQE